MILVVKYIQIFQKIQELVGEKIQNIQGLIVKEAGPQSVEVGAVSGVMRRGSDSRVFFGKSQKTRAWYVNIKW